MTPACTHADDAHGARQRLTRACAPCQAEAAVLLRLLEVHPVAAREMDENGMLPLHVATIHQPSSAVTRAL